MYYKNSINKNGISYFKAHALPQNSLSLTTTSQDRKNYDKNEEKSDLQKYLNIYESIERKQIILNDKQKIANKISQLKRYHNQKDGIFQNRLIRNSCSQICKQKKDFEKQPHHYEIFAANCDKNKYSLQKSHLLSNKKNQIALKMIGQHKFMENDNNDRTRNTQSQNIIRGTEITDQKNRQLGICPLDFKNTCQFQNYIFQTKNNNFFDASAQSKPYKSYYQSKYQKLYQKPTDRKLRKSKNFIDDVEKYIENQKKRQLILHPQTCNLRTASLDKNINLRNNFIDEKQSSSFQTQMKPLIIQPKSEFQNSKVKQNKILNKRNKKYFFHKKNYQSLKSFSYHPNDEKQNFKNNCTLSITTETPLTKSVFLTSKDQDLSRSIKIVNSSFSKGNLQKKSINNKKITQNFLEKSHSTISVHQNRIQRMSHQMTLNKIQESIANDIQISIRHLDTKG